MRVLVIYCHPDETSFSSALHAGVLESLTASGHTVTDLDLYRDGFDPALSLDERIEYSDPRYVDGQRQLVEAMRYLTQADPVANREAIELISEHVRTRFRMTDSPLG